jgi:hypothetical protein
VTWVLPDGQEFPCRGPEPGPDARLVVRDYRFIRRCLAAGSIGFAEGYMAGEWETPDLTALLSAFALNFDRLQALVDGNPVMRAVNLITHALRRNDRRGSKKNIHAHYDLGNRFYELLAGSLDDLLLGGLRAAGDTAHARPRSPSTPRSTGCEIWGKAEFLNPGQSVKDRAALFIVRDAENARACCARAAPSSRAPPAIPASA